MSLLSSYQSYLTSIYPSIFNYLSISHTSSLGYHVLSKTDIPINTVLYKIKSEDIVCVSNSKLYDEIKDVCEGWNALALCILHELKLGEKSRWFYYLNILPKQLNLPVFWDSKPLKKKKSSSKDAGRVPYDEWFKGTQIIERSLDMESTWKEQYEIVKDFIEGHQDKFDEIDFKKYKHIIGIISSYSFANFNDEEEDEKKDEKEDEENDEMVTVLIPFADTFNHSSPSNIKVSFPCSKSGEYVITTSQNIETGAALYNTYGDLSNTELLLKYGFVLKNNPFDEARIDMSLVEQIFKKALKVKDEFLDERLNFIDESGIFESAMITKDITQNDYIMFEDGAFVIRLSKGLILLERVLTILLLDAANFEKLEEKFQELAAKNKSEDSEDCEEEIEVEIDLSEIEKWISEIKEEAGFPLEKLNENIQNLINKILKARLSEYSLENDLEDFESETLEATPDNIEKISKIIKSSQTKVLKHFLKE